MTEFDRILAELVEQYKEVDLDEIEAIDRNGGRRLGHYNNANLNKYINNKKYDTYEGEYYEEQ